MQDDNSTNCSDYFIINLDSRSLMIEDLKNLQREDYLDNKVIK